MVSYPQLFHESVLTRASPGRFFVAHELKMMFGHLLINYDVKHLAERPRSMWVGRNMVPPTAYIEVRRRRIQNA